MIHQLCIKMILNSTRLGISTVTTVLIMLILYSLKVIPAAKNANKVIKFLMTLFPRQSTFWFGGIY